MSKPRTDVARKVVLEGGRQRAPAARHVGRGGELGLLVDVGSRSQAGFLGSLQQCPLSKAPAVRSQNLIVDTILCLHVHTRSCTCTS